MWVRQISNCLGRFFMVFFIELKVNFMDHKNHILPQQKSCCADQSAVINISQKSREIKK